MTPNLADPTPPPAPRRIVHYRSAPAELPPRLTAPHSQYVAVITILAVLGAVVFQLKGYGAYSVPVVQIGGAAYCLFRVLESRATRFAKPLLAGTSMVAVLCVRIVLSHRGDSSSVYGDIKRFGWSTHHVTQFERFAVCAFLSCVVLFTLVLIMDFLVRRHRAHEPDQIVSGPGPSSAK